MTRKEKSAVDKLGERLTEAIMAPSNVLAEELDKVVVRLDALEWRLEHLTVRLASLAAKLDALSG